MRRTFAAGLVALLVLTALCALPLVAYGAPIYVSVVGSDTAGNGSLSNPYRTVQRAVNVGVSGDVVRVGPGTFSGGITMKNGVSLEATGAGTGIFYTELTTPMNSAPVVTAENIGAGTHISGFKIDGATSGWGIYCSHSSPTISHNWVTGNVTGIGCYDSSAPTISDNEDISQNTGNGIVCNASSPTILSNDIRQNHAYGILCTATASPSITGNTIASNWSFGIECAGASSPGIVGNYIGGNSLGIDCIGSSSPSITGNDIYGNNIAGIKCNNSSPSIINDTIRDGIQDGIGLYNGSSPSITGSTLTGNDIGVYCSYSSPSISNCTIVGTGPTSSGSGIHCYYGAPSIANCTISGSSHNIFCDSTPSLTITSCALSDGWFGIDITGCSPSVTNCTINGNIEGIYCETASPTITNCTISGNSSGIGWYTHTASSPTITNCIVWNPDGTQIEAGTATYSDVLGGAAGTGNINVDPSFVNAATGDFHLNVGSPCIDAGTSTGAPATDKDGAHRPLDGGWDMGAYEHHPATCRLHYAAGASGSIIGSPTQIVSFNGDGSSVIASPTTGFHFTEWSDHSSANPRTDTNVTADATYTAAFAINTYTLKYAPGTGGALAGVTSQTVNYNTSGTSVTAVPDTANHYHFVNWSDGSLANPRTDSGVAANVNVIANFALDTYTIAVAPSSHGTIAPAGDQVVEYGSSKTFTVTPNTGYRIVDVSKDGLSIGASTTVTFVNVTEEGHTLAASFAINTSTLALARSTASPAYDSKVTLSATLVGNGAAAVGQTVIFERLATTGWVQVGTATTGVGGVGVLSVKPYGRAKTVYRARFAATAAYAAAMSANSVVTPKVYLTKGNAPKTMYKRKVRKIYGYLKPRHTSGSTSAVRIYRYKKNSKGIYVKYDHVHAKLSNYSTYSKYAKSFSFPSRGKWRVRAYAPADSKHAATWSGYDYVSVK